MPTRGPGAPCRSIRSARSSGRRAARRRLDLGEGTRPTRAAAAGPRGGGCRDRRRRCPAPGRAPARRRPAASSARSRGRGRGPRRSPARGGRAGRRAPSRPRKPRRSGRGGWRRSARRAGVPPRRARRGFTVGGRARRESAGHRRDGPPCGRRRSGSPASPLQGSRRAPRLPARRDKGWRSLLGLPGKNPVGGAEEDREAEIDQVHAGQPDDHVAGEHQPFVEQVVDRVEQGEVRGARAAPEARSVRPPRGPPR